MCILCICCAVSEYISYLLDPEEGTDKGSVNWSLFRIYVAFVTEKVYVSCLK